MTTSIGGGGLPLAVFTNTAFDDNNDDEGRADAARRSSSSDVTREGGGEEQEDEELERAIAMSIVGGGATPPPTIKKRVMKAEDDEEAMLAYAIHLSLLERPEEGGGRASASAFFRPIAGSSSATAAAAFISSGGVDTPPVRRPPPWSAAARQQAQQEASDLAIARAYGAIEEANEALEAAEGAQALRALAVVHHDHKSDSAASSSSLMDLLGACEFLEDDIESSSSWMRMMPPPAALPQAAKARPLKRNTGPPDAELAKRRRAGSFAWCEVVMAPAAFLERLAPPVVGAMVRLAPVARPSRMDLAREGAAEAWEAERALLRLEAGGRVVGGEGNDTLEVDTSRGRCVFRRWGARVQYDDLRAVRVEGATDWQTAPEALEAFKQHLGALLLDSSFSGRARRLCWCGTWRLRCGAFVSMPGHWLELRRFPLAAIPAGFLLDAAAIAAEGATVTLCFANSMAPVRPLGLDLAAHIVQLERRLPLLRAEARLVHLGIPNATCRPSRDRMHALEVLLLFYAYARRIISVRFIVCDCERRTGSTSASPAGRRTWRGSARWRPRRRSCRLRPRRRPPGCTRSRSARTLRAACLRRRFPRPNDDDGRREERAVAGDGIEYKRRRGTERNNNNKHNNNNNNIIYGRRSRPRKASSAPAA